MPNLTAAEVIAHPAYQTVEWDLKPTKEGFCEVAKGRSGGPFKLKFEVHGTGDIKLVWIMGLGAYRTAWKRQTKYFGHTHGSRFSSLVLDNRGMGLSDKPLSRYSTSEMAQDVLDLLRHLGWVCATPTGAPPRDLHIVGVSMGGMIAQEVALVAPAHIASLALVSTAPRLVRTVPFMQNLRQRINMFVPRDIDVQLAETTHRLFSDAFLATPDTEQRDPRLNYPTNWERFAAGELSKRSDKDGFTRKGFILQAIAAGWHYRSAREMEKIGDEVGRERIAVLHGTADRMITFYHAGLLKAELGEGIEYKVWEGKGHVLMWEEEDEFNRFIEAFVEKCDKLARSGGGE